MSLRRADQLVQIFGMLGEVLRVAPVVNGLDRLLLGHEGAIDDVADLLRVANPRCIY